MATLNRHGQRVHWGDQKSSETAGETDMVTVTMATHHKSLVGQQRRDRGRVPWQEWKRSSRGRQLPVPPAATSCVPAGHLSSTSDTSSHLKADRDPWPLTESHRVAVVKNAMYETFLRNTTNQLQDDLRCTMKVYNSEKQHLVHQLASLRGSERSGSPMSMDSSAGWSLSTTTTPRKPSYFRAPNIAATSRSVQPEKLSEKKWREKKDFDKLRTEKDLLKLPVIRSASSNRSEWDSGKNLNYKRNESEQAVVPLPGISAAKELLKDSIKIPTIYDPQRTDAVFDTMASKERKKVTFADENDKKLHSVTEIEPNTDMYTAPHPSAHTKFLPRITVRKAPTINRSNKPKRNSQLPPLELTPREVRYNPKQVTDTVNEWKSIYSNIIDPEERTRALSDILYAVRLKKLENEQKMKYGDSPRPMKSGNSLCDYTHLNNDRIEYRGESGQKKRGCIPKNTAARLGRKSNAVQLQNYLRKMSRSRRMIEHLEAEEYRLAHVSGHQSLQGVTQTPLPA